MIKTIRMLAAFFVLFLLLSACSTVRPNQEAAKESIVVKKLVKASTSWDGSLLPAYPQGRPEITILRITIPAGTQLEFHHHPVINAGVLINGQLTVKTKEGKTLHLKAGDPIIEVMNTSHYGVNPGTDPAEIIVFYAGVVDAPITVVEPR